jgi:hypothetical protein
MPDYFSYLHPLAMVKALFWGGVLASAASLVTDRWLQKSIRDHWKLILVLVLLVLSWRIPWEGTFFHGLEYEDSYVYTVASRQMLETGGPSPAATEFPYSIDVCVVGSLNSCHEWQAFREHFIGYPYTVSLLSRLIGYRPDVGSIENVVAACMTGVLIFFIALLATSDVMTAGAAAIVFAITPVFAVYGLETSAEPASNACLSLVIWLYVRSISTLGIFDHLWRQWMRWCALIAVLLFSMTVKREDIMLALILPVILPLVADWRAAPRFERIRLLVILVLGAALALAFCVHMRLPQTAEGEAGLLRAYPLTVGRLAMFVYSFARSFFVNEWYGGAAFVVAIGAVVCCRRRGLLLVPLVVFIAFGLLYAFHIRSYYEMRSGHVESLAALRFSMNLMTVWALLAGIGIGAVMIKVRGLRLYGRYKRISLIIGVGTLAFALAVSFVITKSLRADAVEDETNVRLTPTRTALEFASRSGSQSDYILTMEPLIVQMYANSTVRVVDLANISSTELEKLIDSGQAGLFVYLDESIHQSEADSIRYGTHIRYLNSLSQRVVYNSDEFKIISVDLPLR